MLSFLGQLSLPRKPVLNSTWSRIVGGSCEAKIAELPYEIAQDPRGGSDRGLRGLQPWSSGRRNQQHVRYSQIVVRFRPLLT